MSEDARELKRINRKNIHGLPPTSIKQNIMTILKGTVTF